MKGESKTLCTVSATITRRLRDRIDAVRGKFSRSAWLTTAIMERLNREEIANAIAEYERKESPCNANYLDG